MRKRLGILAILGSLLFVSAATANEPGWEGGIIRFGADRERIRSMHILDRPYRPFHVYGNVVRRLYYRGRIWPSLDELTQMLGR